MAAENRLAILLEAQIAGFQANMDRATRKVDVFGKEVSDTNRELGGFGSSLSFGDFTRQTDLARKKVESIGLAFSSVGRLIGGAFALGGVTRLGERLTEISDDIKLIDVRARGLGGGSGGFDTIYRSAQRLGIPIADAADGINSMAPALARIGVGFQDSVRFAEDLNQSMRLFGVSGAQAASVVIQLSQGLLSGTLAGDELKSLRENAAGLLPAFEAAVKEITGMDGSLKDLGSQGVLTSDVVYRAFQQTFRGLRGRFDELPNTLEQNKNRIANSWDKLVASIDQRWKVSEVYKDFTGGLATKLDTTAQGLSSGQSGLGKFIDDVSRKLEPLFKIYDKAREKAVDMMAVIAAPNTSGLSRLEAASRGVTDAITMTSAAAANASDKAKDLNKTLESVANKRVSPEISIEIKGDPLKTVNEITERLTRLNRGDELNALIDSNLEANLAATRKAFADLWKDINSFDPSAGVQRTAQQAVRDYDEVVKKVEQLKEITKDPLNQLELQRAAGQLKTFARELFQTPDGKTAPTTYLEALDQLVAEGAPKFREVSEQSKAALQASTEGFAAWQAQIAKTTNDFSGIASAAKAAVAQTLAAMQSLTQQTFTINVVANVSEQVDLQSAEQGAKP